mmetsp:Transcript_36323/g.108967  ORF Transcript_36323/g.108967 Transcript_36323/m.108967 type:complete len:730 (-) Transcript_36323:194-2383(-)
MSLPDWPSNTEDPTFDILRELQDSGRHYMSVYLKNRLDVIPSVIECTKTLRAWQDKEDKTTWCAFQGVCGKLVCGEISEDVLIQFLIVDLPTIMAKLFGPNKEVEGIWEHALQIIAGTIYGPSRMIRGLRDHQVQLVREEWGLVYSRAGEEFGKIFYDHFTDDPQIASLFTHTQFAMQRQNFVHQLNSILLRIDQDMEHVVKPMLLELGARHRVHYLVGLSDMVAVTASIVHALKALIGPVHFTPMENAWAYATNLINFYMISGWACGMALFDDTQKVRQLELISKWPGGKDLVSGVGDWMYADIGVLSQFRNSLPKAQFSEFFPQFAKAINQKSSSESGARYESIVGRIIDEADIVVSRERLSALGRRHRKHHGVAISDLEPAASQWMSVACGIFGSHFTHSVALEWARLWTMIATSMCPEYKEKCLSALDLADKYRVSDTVTAALVSRLSAVRTKISAQKRKGCDLTLVDKEILPGRVARLSFKCSAPHHFNAGQYAKIRWTLPGGKIRNRFYSIASAPNAKTNMTETLELCIKEVPKGNVSPFIYGQFSPPASCKLVLTAGHFTLPSPLKSKLDRMMISGGIGIIAFIGVIRNASELSRQGLLEHKLSLTLIHSDRTPFFPFRDELLSLAAEFAQTRMFQFRIVLSITRGKADDVANLRKLHPLVPLHSERLHANMIQSELNEFGGAIGPHCYMCGPGVFQKAMRANLINVCGHPKKFIHQEFFDL